MNSRVSIAVTGALALLLTIAGMAAANAAEDRTDEQVCNATADYFLGQEDYGEAIATHRRLIEAHPADALAHYHLGFAYGMTGERAQESPSTVWQRRWACAMGPLLESRAPLLQAGDVEEAASR
jgi:hypothetical protein